MVAVLLYTDDIIDTDLGVGKETVAYLGGIQHHLGMDILYGLGTAFGINICMPKYLMPMARCSETKQTVKSNDLGHRYTLNERQFALLEAERLAANVSTTTGKIWQAYVAEFSVDAAGRVKL